MPVTIKLPICTICNGSNKFDTEIEKCMVCISYPVMVSCGGCENQNQWKCKEAYFSHGTHIHGVSNG